MKILTIMNICAYNGTPSHEHLHNKSPQQCDSLLLWAFIIFKASQVFVRSQTGSCLQTLVPKLCLTFPVLKSKILVVLRCKGLFGRPCKDVFAAQKKKRKKANYYMKQKSII